LGDFDPHRYNKEMREYLQGPRGPKVWVLSLFIIALYMVLGLWMASGIMNLDLPLVGRHGLLYFGRIGLFLLIGIVLPLLFLRTREGPPPLPPNPMPPPPPTPTVEPPRPPPPEEDSPFDWPPRWGR